MKTFHQFSQNLDEDLGKKIKKFTKDNKSYGILDSHPETHGSTWQAGGCGVFAHALHKHLPGSKLVDVHNHSTGNTEHVAVHHEDHIYDANGAHPANKFLHRYKKKEGLSGNLELRPHNPKATGEISVHPDLVHKTGELLKHHLDS